MTRTSIKTVTFVHPFVIGELEDVLPPGRYVIEEAKERIPELSRTALRGVRAVIQLPATTSKRREARTMTITPEQLQAALDHDKETSDREQQSGTPVSTGGATERAERRTRTLTGDMRE